MVRNGAFGPIFVQFKKSCYSGETIRVHWVSNTVQKNAVSQKFFS